MTIVIGLVILLSSAVIAANVQRRRPPAWLRRRLLVRDDIEEATPQPVIDDATKKIEACSSCGSKGPKVMSTGCSSCEEGARS